MAYTVRDTPEVEARVGRDLAAIVAAVRAADPKLRSLVLTGGFARGEGGVLAGRPQNDYDLVAVHSGARAGPGYGGVAEALEGDLGLPIDLAPVAAWRLPFLARSIFWYETALRGRVLWGEELLGRLRTRTPQAIDRAEGLRLVANRAAGLLLATTHDEAAWRRIQAAKALLAALDAHLLAAGAFPPSQLERWRAAQELRGTAALQPLEPHWDWLAWSVQVKTDPAAAPARSEAEAWSAARIALLAAVPVALRHARLPDLSAYARRDGLKDRAVWWRRSAGVPDAHRWAAHPTARVRVAALRLLADAPDGHVHPESAWACLHRLAPPRGDPVGLLDRLRQATLP